MRLYTDIYLGEQQKWVLDPERKKDKVFFTADTATSEKIIALHRNLRST